MIDAGLRRRWFVDEASGTSHGFLSRDGAAPGEIAAQARRSLRSYPSVRWIEGVAEEAHRRHDGRFALRVGVRTLVTDRLVLEDGRVMSMRGLFTQPRAQLASPIASQLGCALLDGPTGAFIQVDAMQQTSVPNVFACGDAARAAGNVALAVADGAMGGISAHRSTTG